MSLTSRSVLLTMADSHFPDLDLTPLMNPRTIGIVGASQRRSRGTRVLENLLSTGFDGPIYPINARYDEVQGLACYPSAADAPEPIDCLVVAIPGAAVPGVLADAKAVGTRSAVVLSSGFREAGPEGLERHNQLEALAREGMPICGPNCYGVLNLSTGSAAFSGRIPEPRRTGELAFVSQSGGFTNMIVNPLVEDRGLGFKYMVSCGNQVGARVEDYLSFLVDDPDVRIIGAFVEGLSSAAALLDVGERAAAAGKRIVMLKTGRSPAARAAVSSHTGSIAGSSDVVDAVLGQAGIIAASSLDEMAEILALLACGDPMRIGSRVLVITGSGGESSHAADAAFRAGVTMAPLQESSEQQLRDEVLPDFGNPRNPLDGTGAMFENPDVFPGLLAVAVDDENSDIVAVNLGQRPPGGAWAPMRNFAKNIAELSDDKRKRVVGYGSMSVGPMDDVLMATLRDAGVPFLAGSDLAMSAIAKVAANNRARSAGPISSEMSEPPNSLNAWPEEIDEIDIIQMWDLMRSAGLPVTPQEVVADEASAVAAAVGLGYPVVIKAASFEIAHKSDIGAVAVGLESEDDVRIAYRSVSKAIEAIDPPVSSDILVQRMAPGGTELIVGILRDPALGPALVVGSGGVMVDLLEDSAVGIPPINRRTARRMLESLRGYKILTGLRGAGPADIDAAIDVLVSAGRLASTLPEWASAVDLNPVIVHPESGGATCVDVWVEMQ